MNHYRRGCFGMAYLIDDEKFNLSAWADCGSMAVEAYGLENLPHWKQEGGRIEAQRLFDAKEFVKGIEIDDEILKEHIYSLDNKNLGKSEYNCLRMLRKQYRQAIENEYIQSRDRVLNQFYSYSVNL